MAELVTLFAYLYRRQVAAGTSVRLRSQRGLGLFVGAGARIIEEQEKKVIALPLRHLGFGITRSVSVSAFSGERRASAWIS